MAWEYIYNSLQNFYGFVDILDKISLHDIHILIDVSKSLKIECPLYYAL